MKPIISVIIPVYNSASFLEDTLTSILNQTFPFWEVILVDDGSTDESISILQEFSRKDRRFRIFERPEKKPKGGNSCRNYGFELAEGDYIQWFDSDDLMCPNMLELKLNCIGADQDFVVCEAVEFRGSKENLLRKWEQVESEFPLLDHALGRINFLVSGPMFKQSFLQGKKLFDETLQRKQEWEFFTRLLSFSPSYCIIKEPLILYRVHNESINGKNSRGTIRSRHKADVLVFNTLQRSAVFTEINSFELRKHFFLKIWMRNRKTFSLFGWKDFMLGNFLLLSLLSLDFLRKGAAKLYKKPKILSNLFK